jgi:hypothetical protein
MAVVCVLLALGPASRSVRADVLPQWLDCFEDYTDSDALRAIWTFVGSDDPNATLDLECDKWKTCPNPWCSVHKTEGSAWETDGCQYMRINYLVGTVAARMVVNPPADFSGQQFLSFYYRGRFDFINGPGTLQLQLAAGNGAPMFYGPEVAAATQCSYVAGMLECPWVEYKADISAWPGKTAITQADLVIKDATRNGRLYIDCVHLYTPPVATESATWGMIKALYR